MSLRTLVLVMAVGATGALVACGPRSPENPVGLGAAVVPDEARAAEVAGSTNVIGDGTPASCTSDAVVAAVARGGVITFDCGPDPLTITMAATAKVVNDTGPEIVIDGGGLVTLSGAGRRRILYMNTCDPAQRWTTSHCEDQDHPRLTIQNLTVVDGNASGETDNAGGGAVFARGGRLKIVNTTFRRNRCDETGPDVGGGAVRVLDQSAGQPVFVVNSVFGGASGQGNACSNGGALSGIGVSWTVLNSVLSHNQATGTGAGPARPGTPGGGNGGAIALDGDGIALHVAGSVIEDNYANEAGGGIFLVSNDRTGTLRIETSILRRNTNSSESEGLPGVYFVGAGSPEMSSSPPPEPAPPVAAAPRRAGPRGGPRSGPAPIKADPVYTG